MKRFLLLLAVSFTVCKGNAQSFVKPGADGRIRLADVIKEHQLAPATEREEDEEEDRRYIKEGADYHFDRWRWYWQQHTDENGYLISPAKNLEEWRKMHTVRAQSKTTANLSNWTFQGPTTSNGGYSGIGRISMIEFHPVDPNTFWVGTAGGGLWKTLNGGANWICLTDNLPVLSVSDIDVNPKNPNTLYLCTGDRDGHDSYSLGVLKSTNGGLTWDTTGIKWPADQLRLANSLVINQADTNSLLLASNGGIYKSYNGGKKWTPVLAGHFKQVLYHPTDTNIVYATSFYTGSSAQIFRSINGGASWTQVTNFSSAWRITLAVCPAAPNNVKAVAASTNSSRSRGLEGVYNSDNAGASFSLIFNGNSCTQNILSNDRTGNGCSGQGEYDLSIAMSPTDKNKVYVGGVNTWYSPNGGFNWQVVTNWYYASSTLAEVHADKHWLAFNPLLPTRLYECNDGGVYYTDNPTSVLWNDITNGLGITQFYRNAVTNTASYVLGGAQDNGSKGLDKRTTLWQDLTGGDGMECQIDPADTNILYTGVQYGSLYRIDASSGVSNSISDNIPGVPEGAWITPYLVSPHNHMDLIAGYEEIYYSPDQGDSWVSVSGGPLSVGKKMLRLAMTPANAGTIYAVPEYSNEIYYVHNFIPGITSNFSLLTPTFTGYISDIEVDDKNKDHFWITYSGYNSPQVVEYKNGTWRQMKAGLPNVPVLCIEKDSSNDILYVGTDIGVFYKDTTSTQWQHYNKGLPSLHVTDLGINYTTGELWAATYGRGMWKSAKQEYPHEVHVIPFAADAVNLAPNPSNGRFTITANSSFANETVSMRLVDHTGKTIWKNTGIFNGGSKLDVSADNVPAGYYIFEIANARAVMARTKVVINR